MVTIKSFIAEQWVSSRKKELIDKYSEYGPNVVGFSFTSISLGNIRASFEVQFDKPILLEDQYGLQKNSTSHTFNLTLTPGIAREVATEYGWEWIDV